MSKAISMNQIANFQADLDQRPEAKVIERSVTKNGILASSQDGLFLDMVNTVIVGHANGPEVIEARP
ncbi:hypothetical protein WP50_38655 [Lactiplantibacillus plantarum]|nr:hypothetical protein WP50_38655 [Lactiplantibacillus plantarum]